MSVHLSDLNHLDPQAVADLLETADDDPQFVLELFESFIDTLRQLPAQLELVIQHHGVAELSALAHQLKGATGYLGATQLQQLFADLQHDPPRNAEHVEAVLDQVNRQIVGIADDIARLSGQADPRLRPNWMRQADGLDSHIGAN